MFENSIRLFLEHSSLPIYPLILFRFPTIYLIINRILRWYRSKISSTWSDKIIDYLIKYVYFDQLKIILHMKAKHSF